MAHVSLRLQLIDQPLKRNILMRVGSEAYFASPDQELPPTLLTAHIHSQGQGIDEEAD
jgi:hypothetical protein